MAATITCGVNRLASENYIGRSIDDIRRELRTPLNIADGAEVFLNGERHTDMTTPLRQRDELEFVKESGTKGR
jgi:hypothetical protein